MWLRGRPRGRFGQFTDEPDYPRRHHLAGDAPAFSISRVAVSASRKLFIATVLLAAGFGVARLMGEPAMRLYAPHVRDAAASSQLALTNRNVPSQATDAVNASNVRLVPDFAAQSPYDTKRKEQEPVLSPVLLTNEEKEESIGATQPLVVSDDPAPLQTAYSPRARLRNEAPRALDVDNRVSSLPPANSTPSNRLPPIEPYDPPKTPASEMQQVAAVPISPPPTAAWDSWQQNPVVPAGLNSEVNTAPAINASYVQPSASPYIQSNILPPPWPELDESGGLRTHIVVDGDSLERLAGRYLDDARRSNEIFEANRELLSSPDLLPIGAELVIPKRSAAGGLEASMPQSSVPGDVAVRSASNRDSVPVRPIPQASAVTPRARLMRPIPIE
jgi:nucleoid-associated protein YgaU